MRYLRLLLLGLSAVAILVIQPSGPSLSAATDAFVTRYGTQLLLNGQPYRFTGLNIYNANSDGWCWYAMNSGSALDEALTSIGADKNAMRAWFFQPLATSSGVRDWSAFDHTLSVAAAHGYRVVVTLTDQWGECGAREDGGTSYFKTKDWYVNGYTSADPGMLASYRDWVAEVVTRYKDSPTVLMWQLINEAEVQEYWGAGCLPHPNTESRDVLIAWASDVSGLVKSLDPNHLVSLGTIGGGQCGAVFTHYRDVHAISTIDICEYHDYSPTSPMPGDQWNGLQFRIDQCNALNKPLFIGEVGIRPVDVPGGGFADRAAALEAKINAQMGAGIDGILSWAWSNLGSTLNNFDIGPGDPALGVLALFIDSDGDGCAESAELQTAVGSQTSGGQRNPKYFWDFYDVWTHPAGNPTAWERNKAVNISDILGVAARFGPGTVMSKQAALAAALTPPTSNTGYHAAFDRGAVIGPNNWNRAPADGAINITNDILGVANQFGHNCT